MPTRFRKKKIPISYQLSLERKHCGINGIPTCAQWRPSLAAATVVSAGTAPIISTASHRDNVEKDAVDAE